MTRASRRCLLLFSAALASCAGPARPDPLTDVQDPKLAVPRRVEALDAAWSSPGGREEARRALIAIAWSVDAPKPLRLAALGKLLDDPASQADARKTARLMLPLEPDLDVVQSLGDAAARHGWTDLTPALVRSYARPGKGPDAQRPEARSLLALHPGQSLPEIVLAVFLSPARPAEDAAADTDTANRTRAGAWDLLARLDSDGAFRAQSLAAEPPGGDGDRVVGDLQACLRDLRTVPLTGEELLWLQSLRDPARIANVEWWKDAASAISMLTPEQARGLRLRHAEAVRWAAADRSDWLSADRPALLGQLSARLAGRTVHQRQVRADVSKRPLPEQLSASQTRLAWGDILSLLEVDEAIHDPALIRALFEQARQDRGDRTTEFGGLLFFGPDGARAVPYPPRPNQRMGDNQFIASADMLAQGDLAAAHYHFHAAEVFSSSYSGPSEGDLAYASRFGRACLVFTSTAPGVLSADYYQPGGVDIDLGELRAPVP